MTVTFMTYLTSRTFFSPAPFVCMLGFFPCIETPQRAVAYCHVVDSFGKRFDLQHGAPCDPHLQHTRMHAQAVVIYDEV